MIGQTPDITEATVVSHGVLRLTFADGLAGEVDVLDRMNGPVFDQARTPEGFARVAPDPETGTVVWPGGPTWRPTRFTSVCAPGFGPSMMLRPRPRSGTSRPSCLQQRR